MKVLFISNDPTMFDAASPVYGRLLSYAREIGELHVISRAPKGAREMTDGPLSLYPICAGKIGSFFRIQKRAHALILEKGIEVVSAQDPFEYGYIALRAVRGTTAKLHVQIHTDFLSPFFARESVKNRIRVFIADHVLLEASGIRAVSKRIAESLARRYGAWVPPVSVIPIATLFEPVQPVALPPHAFSFTLLAVSRLEKEKRIPDLLQALVIVCHTYPKAGLFIAGTGREEVSLRKQVRDLGLTENVVFLGWRKDAVGLMKSADVFVQASAYEGYGVSLLLAAYIGVPIISTDVGLVGEVLDPRHDLIAVQPENVSALVIAITRLIEDNQLRHTLAHSAAEATARYVATMSDIPKRIAEDLARTVKKA